MHAPGRGPARRNGRPVPGGTVVPRATAPTALVPIVVAFALVALAFAASLARPESVLAACPTAPQPAEDAVLFGDVVFVGTVLRSENEGRWPTVRVEERWKGAASLADTVVVRGGPEPGTATATDRTYLPGRYLFVVRNENGVLADDGCSGTQAWTDELAPLRPAGVMPAAVELPTDPLGSINPGTLAAVAGLLVALLIAIVAYLYVLRARRRPPDWIR
jgi:hypothetical protein